MALGGRGLSCCQWPSSPGMNRHSYPRQQAFSARSEAERSYSFPPSRDPGGLREPLTGKTLKGSVGRAAAGIQAWEELSLGTRAIFGARASL